MIQIQRLAVLVLGLWLGAGVFADIAVTRNFSAIEHFLADPGGPAAATEINAIGRDREREMLRRNAGEENNAIFHDWERSEFAIGGVLLALLALILTVSGRHAIAGMILACAMLAIVAVQDLELSPRIAALGRLIPSMSPNDPAVAHFWTMHGIYSGSEILKLLIGFALALRLSFWMHAPSAAPAAVLSGAANPVSRTAESASRNG